jgi:hypothetical protein
MRMRVAVLRCVAGGICIERRRLGGNATRRARVD